MAALLLSVSPFVWASDAQAKLDVVDQHGNVLITIPMYGSDTWCLLWNHSVAGFTVSDCFINQNNALLLYSSHQPDFAAGLGHLEGRGTVVSDGQGGYLITDINEPVSGKTLVLRIGSMAVNHRVLYEGRESSLSKVAAGQRVGLRLTYR